MKEDHIGGDGVRVSLEQCQLEEAFWGNMGSPKREKKTDATTPLFPSLAA